MRRTGSCRHLLSPVPSRPCALHAGRLVGGMFGRCADVGGVLAEGLVVMATVMYWWETVGRLHDVLCDWQKLRPFIQRDIHYRHWATAACKAGRHVYISVSACTRGGSCAAKTKLRAGKLSSFRKAFHNGSRWRFVWYTIYMETKQMYTPGTTYIYSAQYNEGQRCKGKQWEAALSHLPPSPNMNRLRQRNCHRVGFAGRNQGHWVRP